MQMEGKVSLVTGSSRGIGKAVAKKFLEEGAKVVITGTNETSLKKTFDEFKEQGYPVEMMRANLCNLEEVQALVAFTLEKFGRIDSLVNNAGISKEMPFNEMPIEVWDSILEVNLRSVMLCIKTVLPTMMEQKSGNIVTIGSGAAVRGLPGSAAYSASKAAVVCLCQALGDELRPYGIRVNALCPGPVNTEMFQKSERREFILKAGGDVFEPETVANGVLFLSSDLSEGVSSQNLIMRGFNRW